MADIILDLTEIDKEFYLQYGRAMANWAQLENSFAGIFARVTKMPGRLSSDVFYSARSFLGRADMVLACVPHAPTIPAGKTFLTRSVARAMAYASFRNRLAHNMHTLDVGEGEWRPENARRRIVSGVEGPDHGSEEVDAARLNFANLAILNMVSLGTRKLLREPELSLALLDLLPADAASAQTDPTAVAKLVSELASHPE